MSDTPMMQTLWARTSPLMAGLAWAVPVTLWTGFIVGAISSDAPGLGLSLLVPSVACLLVMLLTERRLTWPGRLLAGIVGAAPVASMVLFSVPSGSVAEAVLSVAIPLSWVALLVAFVAGHVAVTQILAERPPALRFAPLVIWIVLVALWIIIQASPTSPMAQEGAFIEVQMLMIAGLTGLSVSLVSAAVDRIRPLRRRTTRAGRLG